jgi:hypothetical protein
MHSKTLLPLTSERRAQPAQHDNERNVHKRNIPVISNLLIAGPRLQLLAGRSHAECALKNAQRDLVGGAAVAVMQKTLSYRECVRLRQTIYGNCACCTSRATLAHPDSDPVAQNAVTASLVARLRRHDEQESLAICYKTVRMRRR